MYALVPILHIGFYFAVSGTWHPNWYGICCGSTPFRRLSCSCSTLWCLEKSLEYQNHQYRRISTSKTCTVQKRFHSQKHHGECCVLGLFVCFLSWLFWLYVNIYVISIPNVHIIWRAIFRLLCPTTRL